jgi:hypothetical protein
MNIFRATHVIDLWDGQRTLTVALRLVSDPNSGVQVFRDVFANEYVVDPLLGCSAWPKHAQALPLNGQPVQLSWLRSAKLSALCSAQQVLACA